MREVVAHWQLRHENIVALIGLYKFDGEPLPSMVLQYAEHSSARNYLRSHPDSQYFLKIVCACSYYRVAMCSPHAEKVKGSIDGVHYLHTRSPTVVHGDLHDVSCCVSKPSPQLTISQGKRISNSVWRCFTVRLRSEPHQTRGLSHVYVCPPRRAPPVHSARDI